MPIKKLESATGSMLEQVRKNCRSDRDRVVHQSAGLVIVEDKKMVHKLNWTISDS